MDSRTARELLDLHSRQPLTKAAHEFLLEDLINRFPNYWNYSREVDGYLKSWFLYHNLLLGYS